MSKSILGGVVATLLSVLTATPSLAATQVGNEVTCSVGVLSCSKGSAIVGDGTEFTLDAGSLKALSVDYSSSSVTFRLLLNGGLALSGPLDYNTQNNSNPFATATLGTVRGVTGIDQSDITVANGTLTINLGGSYSSGGFFTVNLSNATAAVPEPATWAMMLVGFGGIGFAMRRRKSKVRTTVSYA